MGVVALVAIGAGAVTARRWLQVLPSGGDFAVAAERTRFLVQAALLPGGLTAFGVLLRFVSALTSPLCA